MNQFVLIVGSGLITAALLAVAGVGFTLQFSVTNVLNIAYGSIMSAAALVAYAVNTAGANLWVSGLVAAATGAKRQGERLLLAMPPISPTLISGQPKVVPAQATMMSW